VQQENGNEKPFRCLQAIVVKAIILSGERIITLKILHRKSRCAKKDPRAGNHENYRYVDELSLPEGAGLP
jgi:hypothetical protein